MRGGADLCGRKWAGGDWWVSQSRTWLDQLKAFLCTYICIYVTSYLQSHSLKSATLQNFTPTNNKHLPLPLLLHHHWTKLQLSQLHQIVRHTRAVSVSVSVHYADLVDFEQLRLCMSTGVCVGCAISSLSGQICPRFV